MQRFLLYAQGRKITFHVLCLKDQREVLSNTKPADNVTSYRRMLHKQTYSISDYGCCTDN